MYTKKKKTQNRMREVLHVKDTVFLIDKRCDVKKRVSFFFFFFARRSTPRSCGLAVYPPNLTPLCS
jgi:hypothetical protein